MAIDVDTLELDRREPQHRSSNGKANTVPEVPVRRARQVRPPSYSLQPRTARPKRTDAQVPRRSISPTRKLVTMRRRSPGKRVVIQRRTPGSVRRVSKLGKTVFPVRSPAKRPVRRPLQLKVSRVPPRSNSPGSSRSKSSRPSLSSKPKTTPGPVTNEQPTPRRLTLEEKIARQNKLTERTVFFHGRPIRASRRLPPLDPLQPGSTVSQPPVVPAKQSFLSRMHLRISKSQSTEASLAGSDGKTA